MNTEGQSSSYTASWSERMEEVRRFGLLLGALECVSWQVEPGLRKRIEAVLEQASEPTLKKRVDAFERAGHKPEDHTCDHAEYAALKEPRPRHCLQCGTCMWDAGD